MDSRGARGTHDDGLSYLVEDAECPRGREILRDCRNFVGVRKTFRHFDVPIFPISPAPFLAHLHCFFAFLHYSPVSIFRFACFSLDYGFPPLWRFVVFHLLRRRVFRPKVPFLLFPS